MDIVAARRSLNAARQQRYRIRRRRGETALKVAVPGNAVIEALILSGRLTETEALSRGLVEQKLATVVTDWAARWLKNR
jgi:hypothetical protein